jgi:hypothetical protein
MKITRSQLRSIIRESLLQEGFLDFLKPKPKKPMGAKDRSWLRLSLAMDDLRKAAADAVVEKSSIRGRARAVEDESYTPQGESDFAFNVSIKDSFGKSEQWYAVGDIKTKQIEVERK